MRIITYLVKIVLIFQVLSCQSVVPQNEAIITVSSLPDLVYIK